MDTKKISSTELRLTFHNASSTIGSLLQTELLKDPNIKFAGYSCPHPLETRMILTIITKGKNPKEVLIYAFNNLINKLEQLEFNCFE